MPLLLLNYQKTLVVTATAVVLHVVVVVTKKKINRKTQKLVHG